MDRQAGPCPALPCPALRYGSSVETFALVIIIVGALIVVAGFTYAFGRRKSGEVQMKSGTALAPIMTIGLGTGILVAGIIAALS